MKKILRISSLFLLLAATFSCEEDLGPQAIVQPVNDGPVLNAPASGSNFVLNTGADFAQSPALTLVWNDAAYSLATPINYSIEMSVDGTFTDVEDPIGTTTERFYTMTTSQLRTKLTELVEDIEENNAVTFRITSSLGDSEGLPMVSNAITVNIKFTAPAVEEEQLPLLGVPGNHQGWAPTSPDLPTLAASAIGATDYEGYVYLDGAFKFLAPQPDGISFDWGTDDWGDDGSLSGTLAITGESDIVVAAGYYLVKANTTALTYSTTATQWGIAGDGTANGWDGMIPMTYDAASRTWSVVATLTDQAAPDHGLKFKANGTWDINFGDSGADGSLEYGGTNIATTAGTYLITLDLSNPRHYTYTLTPQ